MEQEREIQFIDMTVPRIWAGVVAVLMILSWKLWLPGANDFPRVPVFNLPEVLTFILQYVATTILLFGLAMVVFVPRNLKLAALMVATGCGLSFLCNQHCLQPWAWQAFIIATLLCCLPLPQAKKWIAWLLISIYLYSAIGKFDYQFVNSLGKEFLNVIYQWLGIGWNDASKSLVLMFPIGELLIGIGLMVRKTRRPATVLAVLLHVALIAILSPLGLGHRPPVLVWNGLSIVLVWWLFWVTDALQVRPAERKTAHHIGVIFALVVLFGPLLRPLQLWDHWLAWGLYSPSNSRVELYLPDIARSRIREDDVKKHFNSIDGSPGISKFRLDQLSLDQLGVPIYPQARFQKAAAIKFLKQHGLLGMAELYELGPSHPRTGERTRRKIQLPND